MKIKFHGILKKLCPKDFYEVVADTPAEAIRGVTMQLKSLRRLGGNRWVCRVKECKNREDLYAHNDQDSVFNLYPDYSPAGGGGRPGVLQIVIGAVIVVAAVVTAFFTGGGSLAALASWSSFYGAVSAGFAGSVMLTSVGMMGVGMILSGLGTLIMSPEVDTKDSSSENSKSRTFGANKNTTEIGTRIAIGYGKYKVYGQLLSVNTESFNS